MIHDSLSRTHRVRAAGRRPTASERIPSTVVTASEDLVGPSEIAELLGVSRRTVARYTRRSDFPRPLGRIAASPIWRHRDVEKWGKEHLPLATGRPPQKPPTPTK